MKKKMLIIPAILLVLALAGVLGVKYQRDIAYYFGERTPAEQTVHAYAWQKRIAYSRYPEALIELLALNPETEEFVLNYPFRQLGPVDLGGFSRETVPLFLQWDPMWGYETYGSGYLAATGCGPTCLAMAGYYLTGKEEMNPLAIAKFAEEQGHYQPGYGSAWTLFSEGAAQLGLEARELPLMEQAVTGALNAGHPVILSVGKGDFTSAGHFLVLAGAEEGGYRVNDPNSPIRSARLWTFEELAPQIKNVWEIALPGDLAAEGSNAAG